MFTGTLVIIGIIVAACILAICIAEISPSLVLLFGVGMCVVSIIHTQKSNKDTESVHGGAYTLILHIPKTTQPKRIMPTGLRRALTDMKQGTTRIQIGNFRKKWYTEMDAAVLYAYTHNNFDPEYNNAIINWIKHKAPSYIDDRRYDDGQKRRIVLKTHPGSAYYNNTEGTKPFAEKRHSRIPTKQYPDQFFEENYEFLSSLPPEDTNDIIPSGNISMQYKGPNNSFRSTNSETFSDLLTHRDNVGTNDIVPIIDRHLQYGPDHKYKFLHPDFSSRNHGDTNDIIPRNDSRSEYVGPQTSVPKTDPDQICKICNRPYSTE